MYYYYYYYIFVYIKLLYIKRKASQNIFFLLIFAISQSVSLTISVDEKLFLPLKMCLQQVHKSFSFFLALLFLPSSSRGWKNSSFALRSASSPLTHSRIRLRICIHMYMNNNKKKSFQKNYFYLANNIQCRRYIFFFLPFGKWIFLGKKLSIVNAHKLLSLWKEKSTA